MCITAQKPRACWRKVPELNDEGWGGGAFPFMPLAVKLCVWGVGGCLAEFKARLGLLGGGATNIVVVLYCC